MQGSSDPNRDLLDADAHCRQLVEKGSVADFLADHRQRLFPDDLFSDLFPSKRGRPSAPADVVASVMLMQSLEGLSDRDAVKQLRTNIAWKVACGLALDDPGFHPTVLVLWRNLLRKSKAPQRIFDATREVVKETGVLSGKQRRVLDSTVLDDAVTRQDTLMQLVAQIRVVRRMIPEARDLELKAHDYENGGAKPPCAWDDAADIDRVVTELVTDANTVLDAVSELELNDAQKESVGLLALVAGQDVEPGDKDGTWRIAKRTAPDRVVSVHDPESRHVHKTVHNYRDGFKAHVAAEPETGLVTEFDLTPGNVGDAQAAPALIANDPGGTDVYGDSAYGSGEFRAHLQETHRKAVIKPAPLQAAVPGGFTIDDFAIDLDAGTVTCPAGQTVPVSARGNATFGQRCSGCPLRQRCTNAADGRKLKLHPQHKLLAAARTLARTPEFQQDIKQFRPMAERTIAWLVAKGNRRVPYRGISRNRIWLGHRVAALNLRRLLNMGLQFGPNGWGLAA